MANSPQPQPLSYQQLLGNSVNTLLTKLGLSGLTVGGPLLSVMETVATGQARTNADLFAMLASQDLDNCTGTALINRGADEGLTPINATYAQQNNLVITDTSFTPITSSVYQGAPAPIAGSSAVVILTNTSFPSTGAIYIGRGTLNYEGPLNYSSITNSGAYSTINLTTPTTRYHNKGESVILSQGGSRLIQTGTICSTQPNNNVSVAQYSILNDYTILDGDNTLGGIAIIALNPGSGGNAAANSITYFPTPPFNGATINNPQPLTNGLDQESEDSFRQRIKDVISSRNTGTNLAITTAVTGATAPDESAVVVSATTYASPVNTLYIDDGTGYEEKSEGIGLETIYVDPSGGSQYVGLTGGTPMAKAFVQTTIQEPYALVDGAELRVAVNGVAYSVFFDSYEFNNINNATAYEVVAAINNDPQAPYLARVCNVGNSVAIQAKADTDEDIQVVSALSTIDANNYLQFPLTHTYTLDLYKNDRLLSKDGVLAQVYSADQSVWGGISDGATLDIAIDGTSTQSITFTNADFIALGQLGVSASAPLSIWAQVFNNKIAGITATVQNGQLLVTSNAGPVSRAEVSIISGSLITSGMFIVQTAMGQPNDYTLNRNTATISLTNPLLIGDTLSAGSEYTRSYIKSQSFTTITTPTGTSNQWWVVDGNVNIIQTGLNNNISIAVTYNSARNSTTLTDSTFGTAFSTLSDGDWIIVWDPSLAGVGISGVFRVYSCNPASISFRQASTPTVGSITMSNNGVTALSCTAPIQKFTVSSSTTYSAATLLNLYLAQLEGVDVYQTNTTSLRVATKTWGTSGQIALVAADLNGQLLPFSTGIVSNQFYHYGFDVSKSVLGTPEFYWLGQTGAPSGSTIPVDYAQASFIGLQANYEDPIKLGIGPPTSAWNALLTSDKYSFNNIYDFTSTSITTDTITNPSITNDSLFLTNPFALLPTDTLDVVFDGDNTSKNYSVPLGYPVKPYSPSPSDVGWYQTNSYLTNPDGTSLNVQFGNSNDFSQYKIFAHPRTYLQYPPSSNTETQGMLFRLNTYGSSAGTFYNNQNNFSGNTYVQYVNPPVPNAPVTVTAGPQVSGTPPYNLDGFVINIALPSTPQLTGFQPQPLWAAEYIAGSSTSPQGAAIMMCGVTGNATYISSNLWSFSVTANAYTGKHHFKNGDYFYIFSGSGLPAGQCQVQASGLTSTGFEFVYVIANGSTASSTNSVLVAIPNPTYVPATPAWGTGAGPGDLISFYGAGFNNAFLDNAFRIKAMDNTNRLWVLIYGDYTLFASLGTTLNYTTLQQPNSLYAPDLSQTTANSAFANLINSAPGNQWVTAAAPVWTLSAGPVTQVSESSSDRLWFLGDTYFDQGLFTGGDFYVESSVYNPGSAPNEYQLQSGVFATVPNPSNSAWATNEDWPNETAYLVPVTIKSLLNYLNNLSINGISNTGNVEAANNMLELQINTDTIGSTGSVQISATKGNTATASVVGMATPQLNGNCTMFDVETSQALGFCANQWVSLQNTTPVSLNLGFGSTSTMTVTNPTSTTSSLTVGTTGQWGTQLADISGGIWRVEKQGNFACYILMPDNYSSFGGPDELCWVNFADSGLPAGNQGYFRIVNFVNNGSSGAFKRNAIWVENPNAVEGVYTISDVFIYDQNSVRPGDTLNINGTVLGASVSGSYKVSEITDAGTVTTITVTGNIPAQGPVTLSGSTYGQFQVVPQEPARLIEKLAYVQPDGANIGYTLMGICSGNGSEYISAALGTVVTALDKLDFNTDLLSGIDAYRVNTGLIAQCNKIVYGDPSDTVTFPGVLSSGTNININGPIVTRVVLSMAVRIVQGIQNNIVPQVQNAVTQLINSNTIGTPIALSSIIDAASNVPGVESVVMISPPLTDSTDTISVQPYEKAMVINVNDIAVSVLS